MSAGRSVFINCPFTPDYQTHFNAIVFTIMRSGFDPRCARENDDGGEVRYDKICRIIAACDYGIHDISKTELDAATNLPRFNMPFELGLFLGAKRFGGAEHARKKTLILDRTPYRYQAFLSDIAGQDIHTHGDDVDRLIHEVASWLRAEVAVDDPVPGGAAIAAEYGRFSDDLPATCARKKLTTAELTFSDFTAIAVSWILGQAESEAARDTGRR